MVRDRRQFVVLPSGPLILVSLPPAQGPHGHHCLDSVAHPELSENCGDVVFHRRLGEIELAAYRLVTLAFHHDSKDIELPAGEAQLREFARSSIRSAAVERYWLER